MPSDRISCEVSEIDQAMLSPYTSENDFKGTTNSAIPTNCANLLKPEDKLKVNNLRPLSRTPVTSRSEPFKCPLQHSSTENVPSGKFSLASLLSLKCLLFLFLSAVCHFFQQFLMERKVLTSILMLFGKLLIRNSCRMCKNF